MFLHAPMYHAFGHHAAHLAFFHLHLPYLCEPYDTTNISACKNVLLYFHVSRYVVYICTQFSSLPPGPSLHPSHQECSREGHAQERGHRKHHLVRQGKVFKVLHSLSAYVGLSVLPADQ